MWSGNYTNPCNLFVNTPHAFLRESVFCAKSIEPRNWIPPHLERTRSKRGTPRVGLSKVPAARSRFPKGKASSEGTGPAVHRRDARPGSFRADPEVTLLSATATEGGGIAFGGRCRRRDDRKTEREPRTRLGVNLIFYSAARSWCASSLLRAGDSWSGRMCECFGQRHRAT